MASEDDFIGIGDWVEHRANTNVFGIVIAVEGSILHVRLSPSLAVAKFHEFELRLAEDGEPLDATDEEPTVAAGNVIDFTKARQLRRDTKTEGAA